MRRKSTLLAISGGIDSMCMADIFVRRCPCEALAVAHCNFNLRGEESDGDEALVRSWAEEHGVRCHVRSFDTKGFAAEHGVSIEMAARELRYRWFAELCRTEGYEEVAVAHNANDNAETLLLNLLRGSGMKGLSGMSEVSDLPYAEGSKVSLVRPLLGMTRKQIEGYALANGVRYRHDSTNFSSEYKRNMLRNEVFPVFERINPSVVRTLNREIGYFAESGEIVSDWADKAAAEVFDPQEGKVAYEALLAHRHWRYLLYHILEPYGFNSATLASIEDLLSSDRTVSGKRFEARDYVALAERDALRIVPRSEMAGLAGHDVRTSRDVRTSHDVRTSRDTRAGHSMRTVIPDPIGDLIMPVRCPGTYHFNSTRIKVEVCPWTPEMPLKQDPGVLVFDAERLRFPFVLRQWRNGDWLVPLGLRGKKKVSDLFTDLKYDAFRKASAVIVCDVNSEGMAESQHIAGVAGVRIDDLYKVTPTTSSVIRVTVLS